MASLLRRLSAANRPPQFELEELPEDVSLVICDYEESPGTDVCQWTMSDSGRLYETDGSDKEYGLLPLPRSTKARLLLLEGVSDRVKDIYCSSYIQIPHKFFSIHAGSAVPGVGAEVRPGEGGFFAKWLRYVKQEHKHWKIETKIDDGRPYDINTLTDPHELRLDHERYSRQPRAYRPYDPIGKTALGDLGQLRKRAFLFSGSRLMRGLLVRKWL